MKRSENATEFRRRTAELRGRADAGDHGAREALDQEVGRFTERTTLSPHRDAVGQLARRPGDQNGKGRR